MFSVKIKNFVPECAINPRINPTKRNPIPNYLNNPKVEEHIEGEPRPKFGENDLLFQKSWFFFNWTRFFADFLKVSVIDGYKKRLHKIMFFFYQKFRLIHVDISSIGFCVILIIR